MPRPMFCLWIEHYVHEHARQALCFDIHEKNYWLFILVCKRVARLCKQLVQLFLGCNILLPEALAFLVVEGGL